MSNLSFFTHEFGDHEIRVVGDGRFSVYDVLVAFGVTDKAHAAETLNRIADKYSEVTQRISLFQFPGRGQRKTPVATEETCEMILMLASRYPGQTAVTSDRYFPRTEHQIIAVLTKAFVDLQPIPQFRVHGYRIDLYLASANIAIEVDEYEHKPYSPGAEAKREAAIKSALGCSFVRFDPYAADFNLGDVIFRIREMA